MVAQNDVSVVRKSFFRSGQPTSLSTRLSVYPIEHPDIWLLYKQQLASFWTSEEIDFSKDREQWDNELTDNERHFLTNILAFFAGSDSVVSLNLLNNFCNDVHDVMEAQITYALQAAMENIHSEVYSLMIETYVQDPEVKAKLLLDLGSIECVKAKITWAQKLSDGCESLAFPRRLIGFCIVEGVFFSGAFCAIYWMKQRNLLPGLTKSNEFIARDEGMHTRFGCLLYNKMLPELRLPQSEVHAMFREALAIAKIFILESVPCGLVGMNGTSMSEYIDYVADGLLVALGYDRLSNATNPFPFMDLIGMDGRSNFFEERVSQYQKASVLDALKRSNDDGRGNSASSFFVEDF